MDFRVFNVMSELSYKFTVTAAVRFVYALNILPPPPPKKLQLCGEPKTFQPVLYSQNSAAMDVAIDDWIAFCQYVKTTVNLTHLHKILLLYLGDLSVLQSFLWKKFQ